MQTPCSSKLAADFFPVRGDTGEGTKPGVAHGLVLIRLTDGRSDAADHGAGNNQWHAPGERHPAWKREQSGVVRDGRLQFDVGVRVVAAVRAFSVAASGVCNHAPSTRTPPFARDPARRRFLDGWHDRAIETPSGQPRR